MVVNISICWFLYAIDMKSKGFMQHIFVDYQNLHEVRLGRVESKFQICNLRKNISRLEMKCNGHSTLPIGLKISGINSRAKISIIFT